VCVCVCVCVSLSLSLVLHTHKTCIKVMVTENVLPVGQMVGIKWQTMDVAKKEEYQQKAQRMKRRAGMVEAAPDEAEPMEEDEAPSPRSRTATDALLAVVDHISSEGGGDNTTNGNKTSSS
jgi:hypothetical protein